MPPTRSNAEWLRALRAGGPEQARALEDLRRTLVRTLPGCLARTGGMPADLLDDVVQDSLLRALDHLDGFEGRSRFTTWVTTIAVRVAMTELRRRRWKDVSLDAINEDGRIPSPPADPAANPESEAARHAILLAVQTLLESQLSERQRKAIVAELRGMPQAEIGRHLGITRNAVYKLGHDARKKLKRGLEALGFDAAEIRAAFQ